MRAESGDTCLGITGHNKDFGFLLFKSFVWRHEILTEVRK